LRPANPRTQRDDEWLPTLATLESRSPRAGSSRRSRNKPPDTPSARTGPAREAGRTSTGGWRLSRQRGSFTPPPFSFQARLSVETHGRPSHAWGTCSSAGRVAGGGVFVSRCAEPDERVTHFALRAVERLVQVRIHRDGGSLANEDGPTRSARPRAFFRASCRSSPGGLGKRMGAPSHGRPMRCTEPNKRLQCLAYTPSRLHRIPTAFSEPTGLFGAGEVLRGQRPNDQSTERAESDRANAAILQSPPTAAATYRPPASLLRIATSICGFRDCVSKPGSSPTPDMPVMARRRPRRRGPRRWSPSRSTAALSDGWVPSRSSTAGRLNTSPCSRRLSAPLARSSGSAAVGPRPARRAPRAVSRNPVSPSSHRPPGGRERSMNPHEKQAAQPDSGRGGGRLTPDHPVKAPRRRNGTERHKNDAIAPVQTEPADGFLPTFFLERQKVQPAFGKLIRAQLLELTWLRAAQVPPVPGTTWPAAIATDARPAPESATAGRRPTAPRSSSKKNQRGRRVPR